MRGLNRLADRRIWPQKANGLWIVCDILSGFEDFKSIPDRGLAEMFRQISDASRQEVGIVDPKRSSDHYGRFSSVCWRNCRTNKQ